jgi:hypothetical protein
MTFQMMTQKRNSQIDTHDYDTQNNDTQNSDTRRNNTQIKDKHAIMAFTVKPVTIMTMA